MAIIAFAVVIGGKWSDLQASKFNTNSQPFYEILSSTGDILVTRQGAGYDCKSYIKFLDSGIAKFKK